MQRSQNLDETDKRVIASRLYYAAFKYFEEVYKLAGKPEVQSCSPVNGSHEKVIAYLCELVHDNGKSSNQLNELKWNRVKADYKGEAFRPDLKYLHRLSRSLVVNGQSEYQKALKNST